MKRIIKVLSLLIIISLVFAYPSNINASTDDLLIVTQTSSTTPSEIDQYKSYEYVINKYDVNITVNENNTFDITETITAYFNVPKHGIFRTIPLKNTITRLDGSTSTNRTQITNISVDNEYTTSRESGNLKIKIGSPYDTLTGEQTYVIKYTYNLGKDPLKNIDELYYNIIGNEWDTVIGNVTFTITMPKEFDTNKLGFSKGLKGSTDSSNITYNVNGNTITGSYNGILGVSEGLTVRCELDEGYFVGAGLDINILSYIVYILPVIFLAISYFLWSKFGRDDQVVETVEFYPPQGFNSLDIGFLYKGKAENEDAVSLLVYLANQGYIKIAETEEKGLFKNHKGFKIIKVKDYDGNNENERLFLEGLFKKRPEISFKSLFGKEEESDKIENVTEVTSSDLYDNFYITLGKILKDVNKKENRNKILEKSASNKTIFLFIMILLSYCIITIPPMYNFGDSGEIVFAIVFQFTGFTTIFTALFGNTSVKKPSVVFRIFMVIFGAIFAGIPFAFLILPAIILDKIYLIGYFVGLACILGMVICLIYLPKRTPYGNEMLGKIKGFKNFLESAEKEKLETMVMEDPTYFYNILPYTYVLGVSDKWIEKFEAISLQAPDWYDSPNAFDIVSFGTFMNTTMVSAQTAMSSSPSSSSGGGSSGGGSGGGGGGSW